MCIDSTSISFFQELQHRSELERLLVADRDQLADDVKQLRTERKEKILEVSILAQVGSCLFPSWNGEAARPARREAAR